MLTSTRGRCRERTETGQAEFHGQEISILGLTCEATVKVTADVTAPHREDDGFHRGEVDINCLAITAYNLFVGESELPDWLQVLALLEMEDELIAAVLAKHSESDLTNALLESVGQ